MEATEGIKVQGIRPSVQKAMQEAQLERESNPVKDAVKDAVGVDEEYVPSRKYINRELTNGDVYKFGRVIAIVMNHPNLKNAIMVTLQKAQNEKEDNGDNEGIKLEDWADLASNAVALLFIHASRDLQLFLADLAGITRDFDDAKMDEVKRARDEDGIELSENEIINRLNNQILKEFSKLPITATTDIITELIDKDGFGPLFRSGRLAAKSMGKVFSGLQTTT